MQDDLLDSISIKDAAAIASVSTATIRNWIKAGYITKIKRGYIAKSSFDVVLKNIVGKKKLNSRANKTKKDTHNHKYLTKWLNAQLRSNTDIKTISKMYEQKLSDSYKNKEGIYYTPDFIIDDMYKDIKFHPDMVFLDPACGTGNFLIKAIQNGIHPKNVYGFDTDKNAVKIAIERVFRETNYKSKNIVVGDFLDYVANVDMTKCKKFDLIFTNPPWGKKMFDTKKSTDTTSLFLFASLKVLKDGGYLGFLTQEAFYNIASFEDVRKFVLKFNVLEIVDYGKAFRGLLTKTQSIILRNEVVKNCKIACKTKNSKQLISKSTFEKNPKAIFNFWIKNDEIKVIDAFFAKQHTTLKNKAKWALGIVTGDNKKFCKNRMKQGYIPVYKGADITKNKLKSPSCYIPDDFSSYQQVASIEMYMAKEKLIYRFISSNLVFFYDDKQRFILNSANLLVPNKGLKITTKELFDLLNSDIMNWVFKKLFNTHKVLRGDLEMLPIHEDFFKQYEKFKESDYLDYLGIEEIGNGAYKTK